MAALTMRTEAMRWRCPIEASVGYWPGFSRVLDDERGPADGVRAVGDGRVRGPVEALALEKGDLRRGLRGESRCGKGDGVPGE